MSMKNLKPPKLPKLIDVCVKQFCPSTKKKRLFMGRVTQKEYDTFDKDMICTYKEGSDWMDEK